MLHEDHARETHVVVPIVFHGALQKPKQTAEILIQLLLINQLLLHQLYGAHNGRLPDAAVGLAGAPLDRGHQDHLQDDFGVEDYRGMQLLLQQQMLHQCQHVHPQLIVLLNLHIRRHYHENSLPVVDDGGEGAADQHVEDEAFGGCLVPLFILFLELL